MKYLIALLLAGSSLFGFAQAEEDSLKGTDDPILPPGKAATRNTFFTNAEFTYGNKFYYHDFYDQLPATKTISPGNAPHWLGINALGTLALGTSFQLPVLVSWSYMLPYRIKINDSIEPKLSGYTVGIPLMGKDLLKSNNADLLVIGGLNAGRLKMSGDERVQSRNPFVSTKLLVMPRIRLARFILSCMAEYSIDISSRKWRQLYSSPIYSVTPRAFSQTGLTLSAGVGFWFNKKK
jgi:hypothetical protein